MKMPDEIGVHVPKELSDLCDSTVKMLKLEEEGQRELLLISFMACAKIGGQMSKVDHERMVKELSVTMSVIAAATGVKIPNQGTSK